MADRSHPWRTPEMEDLFETIESLEGTDDVERFLRDLCTLSELEAMAHRWEVVKLLDQGLPYQEIARRTGASTTTVTRVANASGLVEVFDRDTGNSEKRFYRAKLNE